jgi:anti-sigma factor RsiW
MRCAEVRLLTADFVDGSLEASRARQVEAHAAGCLRCSRELAAERRVLEALRAVPPVRAPKGFSDKVMEGVYRQALAGATAAGREETHESRRFPARGYRRLGLSFVVTATVLAASLLIPRVAYPTLFTSGDIGAESASVVRDAVQGADRAVQQILTDRNNGGSVQ